MAVELKQRGLLSASDVEVVSIDYQDWLDSSEVLTGTPTVVEPTTSGLAIASISINASALTILDRSVSTGQAVQFKVSGQSANTEYRVRVTAATNATVARTKVVDYLFSVSS